MNGCSLHMRSEKRLLIIRNLQSEKKIVNKQEEFYLSKESFLLKRKDFLISRNFLSMLSASVFLSVYFISVERKSTGVQSINDAFHNVNKGENVCVNKYNFDLNDNVECVVYALYSRVVNNDVFRTYFFKIF
jgi:hypothetical protein